MTFVISAFRMYELEPPFYTIYTVFQKRPPFYMYIFIRINCSFKNKKLKKTLCQKLTDLNDFSVLNPEKI